jgi:predicted Zn-dependent protease
MKLRRLLTLLTVVACAAALLLTGCASNSKQSKKKRTILMTEYDDARVGKEQSAGVAVQMGVLDDSALTAYVSEIGHKLLRGVPRRGFNYEFSVVDQEEPNAFALPGGYIFISRGLLALTNNEDELACVIGHEITHAAHRHAASQQALAKRSYAMGYIRAAQMASYGRDMERDADKGGQILCAAAGYDPMGLSTFLTSLGASDRVKRLHTRCELLRHPPR